MFQKVRSLTFPKSQSLAAKFGLRLLGAKFSSIFPIFSIYFDFFDLFCISHLFRASFRGFGPEMPQFCPFCRENPQKTQKAYGTRDSQAVSDPSTNRARRCLTWQIGRDAVFSTWYGRKRPLPGGEKPRKSQSETTTSDT